MRASDRSGGFTLVEVLIALGITAFVSAIAYTSLSSAIAGVESTRETTRRVVAVNRAWSIIARDLRQVVPRPVLDEFGEEEPALVGGPAARFALSLTRTGWHNPAGHPRSHLQRVNYRLEDDALWRDSYAVLDRVGDTEPREVMLLEGVEELQFFFLGSLQMVDAPRNSTGIDTRNWAENWVRDTSVPDQALAPPLAVEVRLQLADWGEMRRIYVLPPL